MVNLAENVKSPLENCCWKDAALLFLRSLRSQALTWLPKGFVEICLGTTVSTPRRDKTMTNSLDRCSCECRSWIVARIDLPLATDPFSPGPSRLANVRYCLIRFPLYSGMSSVNKYTCYSKSIIR